MKTTVIPAIKNTLFYAPFVLGGAALYNQIAKIPGVKEGIDSLESIVASNIGTFPENTCEFLIGGTIAGLTAHAIKKIRKKKDFEDIINKEDGVKTTPEKLPLWRRALAYSAGIPAVAAVSGGFLMRSYELIPKLYNSVAGFALERMEDVSDALAAICNNPAGKTVLAAGAVGVASKLYSMWVSKEHGPIAKRYSVDGWMAPTKWLHPKALKARRSGLVLGAEFDEVRGMHSATKFCATINSKDYKTGRKKTVYMAYRADREPHETKRDITMADVKTVFDYLKEHVKSEGKEMDITPNNIITLADKSGIYRAVDANHFIKENKNLTAFDIGRIIKGANRLATPAIDEDNLVKRLNAETLYDIGGGFQAGIYEKEGGTFSLKINIRENPNLSLAISKDPRSGYGENYVEKKKMLMALQFRRFGSGGQQEEEEGASEDAGADDAAVDRANAIREDRKAWNQIIKHGLGKSYILYMGDKTYHYDEWWAGSGKFMTDLIPGLSGKEYAPRRIGYVYEGDRMVAKIEDDFWTAPTKLLGNYNRTVDVYDRPLANDDNFGHLLCLFSRFLTHQRKYRENRIQEALPAGAPTGGADEDLAGQV